MHSSVHRWEPVVMNSLLLISFRQSLSVPVPVPRPRPPSPRNCVWASRPNPVPTVQPLTHGSQPRLELI
ncbi:unnamed protein product [Gadus morhua 'NCC']